MHQAASETLKEGYRWPGGIVNSYIELGQNLCYGSVGIQHQQMVLIEVSSGGKVLLLLEVDLPPSIRDLGLGLCLNSFTQAPLYLIFRTGT